MRHKGKPKPGVKSHPAPIRQPDPAPKPIFDKDGNRIGELSPDPWENWANR